MLYMVAFITRFYVLSNTPIHGGCGLIGYIFMRSNSPIKNDYE